MTPEPEMTDVGSPAEEMANAFASAESDASPGTDTEAAPAAPIAPDKYVIDGQEYTADQIREWRRGNMLLKDYTQKTQKHAQERRAFEQQYRDAIAIHQAIQEDPGLLKHLQGYYQQPEPTNGMEAEQRPFDLSRDPMFRELRNGYRQMQDRLDEQARSEAGKIIDAQMGAMSKDYASADWAALSPQIIEKVIETGLEPEQVFWTFFRSEALKAHEDNLRRKTEADAAAKRKAQVEPGGSDIPRGLGKQTTKAERDATLAAELSEVFQNGLPDEE